MTRTPDSNTEKLTRLYEEAAILEKRISFLDNKRRLLMDTWVTTSLVHVGDNLSKTEHELSEAKMFYNKIQYEIDDCLDKQI